MIRRKRAVSAVLTVAVITTACGGSSRATAEDLADTLEQACANVATAIGPLEEPATVTDAYFDELFETVQDPILDAYSDFDGFGDFEETETRSTMWSVQGASATWRMRPSACAIWA